MTTHNKMIKKWMEDPKFKEAYDSLADEFSMFDEMRLAREKAKLTQEDVADRMGTKKSAIARLEASGGAQNHSPSVNTLRKYVAAIGCRLEIKFKVC